ncbi:MAG TPA: glutamine synthetase type III, partial [Bacteroidales bacterium]|nr:glutamine synthetase type III [Bacteroidales bacterium]
SLFSAEEYEELAQAKLQKVRIIEQYTDEIQQLVESMVDARKVANKIEDDREKAIAYHDTVEPFLDEIRQYIDKLELMVDNELWPLPKYRELLFIK